MEMARKYTDHTT